MDDMLTVKFQGEVQQSHAILGKFGAPEQPNFKHMISSVLGKTPM